MKRRSFILSAGALALSSLVAGCDNRSATLRVRLLKNSIPAQLLNEFRKQPGQQAKLDFTPETQLEDLFANLLSWRFPNVTEGGWWRSLPFVQPKTPIVADLVTLGDYWLTQAIEQKLIQPLDPAQLKQWSQLPRRWQELVTRNDRGQPDPKGKVWGAPYRWGSTVIAYRRDKFEALGWTPADWQDLWREELRDRISLLDQPREVIGLTLKYLGYSYNTPAPGKVSGLKDALQKLHRQVKFYSSDTYLQPLVLGDTWLAVGWSADVLSAQKREPRIAAVVPKSGTALWTDLWVRPESATASTIPYQWIDFCWQSQIASQISLFSRAASPVIANMKPDELPNNIRRNSLLLPDVRVLQNSEFLAPLPQEAIEQYLSLWQEIRNN